MSNIKKEDKKFHKKIVFISGSVIIFIFVIIALIFSLNNKDKTESSRVLKDTIVLNIPNEVEYTTLSTDTNEKQTIGVPDNYAISISMEDAYTTTINQYGSIEKAKKELNIIEDEYGIDGFLFATYLSSYLGGVSKNIGIPVTEEIIELDNGIWLHYYGYPKMQNGDTMETYITWNDGVFYFVELAYKNERPQVINDFLSTIQFKNGNCNIPYDLSTIEK